MSWKAQAWAAEQRAGSAPAKLVLMIYASFAGERGWAYPSTPTVAEISELDAKTVRAAIDKLELRGLLIDTGKRAGRTGQVKVYRLAMESLPETDALQAVAAGNAAEPDPQTRSGASEQRLPKPVALASGAKAPVSGSKGPQKREAEPSSGTQPPDDADASSAPLGAGRNRGFRIPDDWEAPPIADLPPQARAIAAQWPSGAYETLAEAHHGFWLSEARAGARKLDWDRTWANRVVEIGAKPLRDAKAGVSFEQAGKPAASRDRLADLERGAALFEKMGRFEDAVLYRAQADQLRSVGPG